MPKYVGTDFNTMDQGKIVSILFLKVVIIAFLENSTEFEYLEKNTKR